MRAVLNWAAFFYSKISCAGPVEAFFDGEGLRQAQSDIRKNMWIVFFALNLTFYSLLCVSCFARVAFSKTSLGLPTILSLRRSLTYDNCQLTHHSSLITLRGLLSARQFWGYPQLCLSEGVSFMIIDNLLITHHSSLITLRELLSARQVWGKFTSSFLTFPSLNRKKSCDKFLIYFYFVTKKWLFFQNKKKCHTFWWMYLKIIVYEKRNHF